MTEFNFNSYDNSKQTIIIDGVDVSECFYWSRYAKTTVYHCDWGGECKEYPNCYYKKLKRKEQECERLDNEAQNLFTEKTNLEIELSQLKAENEELKETISDKEKWLSEIEIKNSEYWKEKYADLHIRYGNRIEELKQALQDIKEIITNSFDSCYVCNGKDSCEKCLQGEILQKCEVIKD